VALEQRTERRPIPGAREGPEFSVCEVSHLSCSGRWRRIGSRDDIGDSSGLCG
jgi:hypothetical protein